VDLDLHLLVRMVHVVTATVVVGAPVALALVLRAGPPRDVVGRLVRSAEQVQWSALAVLVATGIGNLAVFGEAIPAFDSEWGRTLTVKLGWVLVLLVVSAVRTFVVAANAMPSGAAKPLANWYAATAVIGVLVVLSAEVLAHG
jgi:putative copper export protein